jgi:hypothetical protein
MDRSEEIKKLKEEIQSLTSLKNEYKNEEQGIKLTMNSIYGAIGNNYFACFNPDVAEAVTLQGQDLIKYSSMLITRYFHEFWHMDTDLHQKLGISVTKKILRPLTVYGDTDSVFSDTLVRIKNSSGLLTYRIDDLFNFYSISNEVTKDDRGNEIILNPGIQTLNYIGKDLVYSPIKRIIRHKVTKAKWKLKTKSGKEIIVTNDHSLTVFRNGEKIHLKASEINPQTDKILEIHLKD